MSFPAYSHVMTIAMALRDSLRGSEAIAGYFAQHFPLSRLYLAVSPKPDMQKGLGVGADLFPYIAITPTLENCRSCYADDDYSYSLMFGVNCDETDDGLSLGQLHICNLAALIRDEISKAFATLDLVVWDQSSKGEYDATLWPYFEGQITITINSRLP
jgi:hypothetical protein